MPRIGIMTTGAGVVTTRDQEYLDQNIQIGEAFAANILRGLLVTVGGTIRIRLTSIARISCLAKLDSMPLISAGASVLTNVIQIAGGQIKQRTQYDFTNDGGTTPIIYGNSTGRAPKNRLRTVKESTINADQPQMYSGFEFLFFNPANVSSVDVYFNKPDGTEWKSSMTLPELRGLWARDYYSEANGLIEGQLCIAGYVNPFTPISKVEIYNGAGGITTVATTGWERA